MNENQTSNMYLAAALVSYGAEICGVNRDNPRRLMWIFKNLPKQVWVLENNKMEDRDVSSIEEVRAIMASNKLLFPPRFVESISAVKEYLFAE